MIARLEENSGKIISFEEPLTNLTQFQYDSTDEEYYEELEII